MSDTDGITIIAGPDDCITSIAEAHGFFWKTIWDHSKNADLKQKRKNPNVLMEGDEVFVPALTIKELDAACEQRHKFKKKGVPAVVRFAFKKDGKPQANEPYTLTIDGSATQGQTDGDGMVTLSIPPEARDASILLGKAPKAKLYKLALGKMDPVSTDSGVRKRLKALGYDPGEAEDEKDDGSNLKNCIARFQDSQKLKVTGDLDDDTKDKLVKAFGC